MSDARSPRQEPRRQRDAPSAVAATAPRDAFVFDVVARAVEAERSVAHGERKTHAKAASQALDERAVGVERLHRRDRHALARKLITARPAAPARAAIGLDADRRGYGHI